MFRGLPENATREQMLDAFARLSHNYALAVTNLNAHLPQLTSAIEDLRAELVVVGTHAARADSSSSGLGGRVNILLGRVDVLLKRVNNLTAIAEQAPASTPPMRAESPSAHEMVVRGTAEITTELQQLASLSPGPIDSVTAPLHTLEQLFSNVFEKETNKRQALLADRAEKDRLAAYDAAKAAAEKATAEQRAKDAAEAERLRLKAENDAEEREKERRAARRSIVVGIVVGTALAIVGAAVAYGQGRVAAHEERAIDAGAASHP